MHIFRYMCIQSYLLPIYAEETQTLKKKKKKNLTEFQLFTKINLT